MSIDYKKTVCLPQTDFPMKAGLPKREPELLQRWVDIDLWGKMRNASKGREPFIPARWTALRERQSAYRPRPQQNSERRNQPVATDDGQGCQLRPRMGLPWLANRMEDRGTIPRRRQG